MLKHTTQKTEDKNHKGAQDIGMCKKIIHRYCCYNILFIRIMAAATKLFLQQLVLLLGTLSL